MNYPRISSQEIGYLRLFIDLISIDENQNKSINNKNNNFKNNATNEPDFVKTDNNNE